MSTINLSNAFSIFADHLPDIRKACVDNVRTIGNANEPYKELDIDGDCTKEDIWQHVRYITVTEKTKPILTVIKRIDGRNKHYSPNRITDEDIAYAKEYPIADLYDGQLFGSKRKYGLCPFHNERSPSFYIFPDNKFKCFGCQAYGSSIDFVMQRDGVDFIKAVKSLRGTM